MPLADARRLLLAFVFASLGTLAKASPDLSFPINSQVPPVAYVSQQYSFTFSASTFVSNQSQLSYTIADGPDWLQLDTATRSFTGKPVQSDIGANIVQLTASDSTGESSSSVAFVVLESTQLGLGIPVLPQLQQAGHISAPNSLLLRPLQPFEVTFHQNTFIGTVSNTIYYATLADRSPLPPWIQFDSSELTFSGTSPPLVSLSAPPQTCGILLIASDVSGFAEATVQFNLVVGYNAFAFTNASQTVEIFSGVPFRTESLRSSLTLNGNVCADAQISSIIAEGAQWVELDNSQISLSGTPQTAIDTLVTISVTDIYNDVANTTVFLQAGDLRPISLGSVVEVNITLGENFTYTLNSLALSGSASVSADLGNASAWLHFNASGCILSGRPPLNWTEDIVPVTIAFANATANVTATVNLHLMQTTITTGMAGASITQSPALPQASKGSDPQNNPPASHDTSTWSMTAMIIAIVLPVLAVLLIICLILLLTIRRRRKRSARFESATSDAMQPNIADSSAAMALDQTRGPKSPSRSPPRPPRIDLTWSNDSIEQSRYRLSGIAAWEDDRASRVSHCDRPLARHSRGREPDKQKIGTLNYPTMEEEKRVQEQAHIGHSRAEPRPKHTESAALDDVSKPEPAAAVPDRRSGAGHGSGVLLRSNSEGARRSWRNSWAFKTVRESKRSTVMLESFPCPPSQGTKQGKPMPLATPTTPLLRVVSSDSVKSVSLETRRQNWHTERARAKLEGSARFSNAGTPRMISSPRDCWAGKLTGEAQSRDTTAIQNAGRLDQRPVSRQHSGSLWSGTRSHDSLNVGRPLNSVTESLPPNARTSMSIASSGQFESVTSSESQWEDVIVKETATGARQWEAGESCTNSPRLPFEPEGKDQEKSAEYARSYARVSDARKRHTSVGEGSLTRAKASQHGSFRFI